MTARSIAKHYIVGIWGSGRRSWMLSPCIEMVAASVATGENLGIAASGREAYEPWEKEVVVRSIEQAGPYKIDVCLPSRPGP
jgi:hypothetical protein